jgi:hypothetical protein
MRENTNAAGRDAAGRWQKGVSGNPGGRPASFAEYIREQTDDGTELVRFALAVLRNTRAPLRLRLEAASWLSDRGWGKPRQNAELLLNAGEDWLRIFPPGSTPAQADAGEVQPITNGERGAS